MEMMPRMRSVMTPFPHSVDVSTPIREARQAMVTHGIRHLPVKQGEELVGVLTDRDLKRALDPELGLPPRDELFVGDVAIFDAYVVDVDASLDGVLDHMARNRIGCALVTREGGLVGIFTGTDACRLFASFLRERHPGPEADRPA